MAIAADVGPVAAEELPSEMDGAFAAAGAIVVAVAAASSAAGPSSEKRYKSILVYRSISLLFFLYF